MKTSFFDKPLFEARVNKEKAKLIPEGALGYLIGPILALLANSFISSYLLKYFTDVLGLTQSWAGPFLVLLQVLSVVLVIVGNLVVGKIMNGLKTKAGKARPLILLSGPFLALALVAIFWLTPLTTYKDVLLTQPKNGTLVMVMTAIGYNLFYAVGYPLYYTSHSALVGLSTRDSNDRGLLATLSNASTLGAMGACTMILPFFLGKIFDTGAAVDTSKAYHTLQWIALALAIVSIIGPIVEFIFTRERISEEEYERALTRGESQEAAKPVSTKEQWKICSKDKFWWIMIAFFFLYQLGGMLKNCSQLYYCNALWGADGKTEVELAAKALAEGTSISSLINAAGGAKSGLIAIIGAVPTALGMLAVVPLSNKFGKGKLILMGGILAVAGGVLGLFAPAIKDVNASFAVAIAAFVIKALGGVPAMYISLALLADVTDHQEAKHGIRTDGLSMAIYGSIMVGMTGIANGIISGILSGIGYKPTFEGMTGSAVTNAMNWVFFGGETICFAVIAALFIFMNVEKHSKEDQEILKARKGEVAAE